MRINAFLATENSEKGVPQRRSEDTEVTEKLLCSLCDASVPLWRNLPASVASYIVWLCPGIATGGTGIGPNSSFDGIRLNGDASSCSSTITLPV